jgi:pyruvate kinase
MMKKYILTVGPSLSNIVKLQDIHNDSFIYRINGAHGTASQIEEYIDRIYEQVPQAQILLDLPGNKIRVIGNHELISGKDVEISSKDFNYSGFYRLLSPGMSVSANDSTFEMTISRVTNDSILFRSHSTGVLTNGKGMHVRGINEKLPFLFEKDQELINLANKRRIPLVGLSFVRNAEDVAIAKSLLHSSEVITKVETRSAVIHLNEILEQTRYILIDRGDLSTDIGIENIPHYQNYIIEKAHYMDKRVFVATQVLKNMEEKPVPTIAEIDDLYNLSKKGIYGVQLSEETAVGRYIHESLDILRRMNQNIVSELIVDPTPCIS